MFNEEIIKPENLVYKKTSVMTDAVMHYCPGCPHGTIHRIIAEVIDEINIYEATKKSMMKWEFKKALSVSHP